MSVQQPGKPDWRMWLWAAQGGSQLACHAAAEVTEIAQAMHGTIKQAPLPLGTTTQPPLAKAPWPYRAVAGVFRYVAKSLVRLSVQADVQGKHGALLPALSALNGVCGDKLQAWQSPWALNMTLRDAHGAPLAWGDVANHSKARVVLFIHGLCLSEREWQTPVHQGYVELLASKGWRVAYLRYNSGLPIWQNGALLSQWLGEALSHYAVGELRLVGHSMGGLLMRSAFAHESSAHWLPVVSGAAYLGTPHHGAPLERAGHWLQSTLAASPYILPLSRLGDIRSAAIKELRYAYLHAEEAALGRDSRHDQRQHTPLPNSMSHLLIAGEFESEPAWIGDGLVPLASALGEHADPERSLTAERLQRQHWPQLNHMQLLGDERVWNAVTDWMLA